MTSLEYLQKAIDYIEEHLCTDLTPEEIAEYAGFSRYHFCHLFSSAVGIPVAAFVTKRRLRHILFAYQEGGKLTHLSLNYGFDTHAGFYKAFKKEFGCSPRHYLKVRQAVLPQPYSLQKERKFMITSQQLKNILKNWPVTVQADPTPTVGVGGTVQSKSTWYVGDDCILKSSQNISGLKTHIAVSRKLLQNGLKSSVPIKTNDGQDFILVDERAFVLLTRISGNMLLPAERYSEGKRTDIAKKYGRAIGQLHLVLNEVDLEMEVNNSHLLDTVKNWAMPECKKVLEQWGCPLPDNFYSEFTNQFEPIFDKLPKQVIHRDANPSNMLVDDGEVTGFIDFEISERNIRLFDPCYCATGILSEAQDLENGYEQWPEIVKGVLKGYHQICPLTAEEVKAIPYVIYAIQMIFIAWLVNNEVYKGAALQNRKMLLWMWENKILEMDFLN